MVRNGGDRAEISGATRGSGSTFVPTGAHDGLNSGRDFAREFFFSTPEYPLRLI
jgi:hypothetical protein